MEHGDIPLNVFGQQSRINRLYTNLTLCFAVPDSQHISVIEIIKDGCKTLSASFPWTAGKIVYQDQSFVIRYRKQDVPCIVKTIDGINFNEIKQAHFPVSEFHESELAPYNTLATSDAKFADLPAFVVQVNVVAEGLLLTFAGQHGAMDMTGLGQLIYLFSKACRKDPFATSELQVGNAKPQNAFSSMVASTKAKNESANNSSVAQQQQSQGSSSGNDDRSNSEHAQPPVDDSTQSIKRIRNPGEDNLVWSCFIFTKSKLSSLKETAIASLISGTFISTDDVLTAFVWLSITHARGQNMHDQMVTTTLSRNVDMRRSLSIAPTYPGLIVYSTTHKCSVETLLQQSTGQVAVQLRSALDTSLMIRQFNERLSQVLEGETKSSPSAVPELQVRLSSWSKEKCYDLDFGFGKPMCVQRPAFSEGARDGLVYLLPKAPNGDIAVNLCLRQQDMHALKGDTKFSQFAAYVG